MRAPRVATNRCLMPVLAAIFCNVASSGVYISPTGDDAGAGTETAPFRSLARAIDGHGGQIWLAPGEYPAANNTGIRISSTMLRITGLGGSSSPSVIRCGGGVGLGLFSGSFVLSSMEFVACDGGIVVEVRFSLPAAQPPPPPPHPSLRLSTIVHVLSRKRPRGVQQGASVQLVGLRFTGCRTDGNGSALRVTSSSVALVNTSFVENTAAEFGGAVFARSANIHAHGASFVGNAISGDGRGGALALENAGLNVTNPGTLSNNGKVAIYCDGASSHVTLASGLCSGAIPFACSRGCSIKCTGGGVAGCGAAPPGPPVPSPNTGGKSVADGKAAAAAICVALGLLLAGWYCHRAGGSAPLPGESTPLVGAPRILAQRHDALEQQ